MIHNTTNKKPHRRTYKNNEDVFITETGHPLTANEAKFIDEYIKTGNKKQSYMNAYPNANPNTAAQLAQKVFNKGHVAEEIKFRLEKMKSESIAEADEIMQYLTAVMRGQIKDQFGLDASLSERTKAAMELAKRKIDIQQKMAVNEQPEVRIVLDWSRDNDTKANISMQ